MIDMSLLNSLNDNTYIPKIHYLVNMLVRLEQVFLETAQKLKNPLTSADKEKLDENIDDVPKSIQQLLPSISPVNVDIMATTTAHQAPDDPNVTYLKVAQVYDDGSRYPRYLDEVRKEDEGISPF